MIKQQINLKFNYRNYQKGNDLKLTAMKKLAIIIVGILISFSTFSKPTYSFFLEKEYSNSKQLFVTLINEGMSSEKNLFFWCCDCIMYYARILGVSYGFLNIILFVVLQPLLIFLFCMLWMKELKKRKRLSAELNRIQ